MDMEAEAAQLLHSQEHPDLVPGQLGLHGETPSPSRKG